MLLDMIESPEIYVVWRFISGPTASVGFNHSEVRAGGANVTG